MTHQLNEKKKISTVECYDRAQLNDSWKFCINKVKEFKQIITELSYRSQGKHESMRDKDTRRMSSNMYGIEWGWGQAYKCSEITLSW